MQKVLPIANQADVWCLIQSISYDFCADKVKCVKKSDTSVTSASNINLGKTLHLVIQLAFETSIETKRIYCFHKILFLNTTHDIFMVICS